MTFCFVPIGNDSPLDALKRDRVLSKTVLLTEGGGKKHLEEEAFYTDILGKGQQIVSCKD